MERHTGGAELGECLATAGRIKESDLGSWHDEWVKTAEESSNTLQTEMFRRAGAMIEQPPEILEIPLEQTTLPGLLPRRRRRSAAGDSCIADCGAFDLHAAFLRRLPPPLAQRVACGGESAIKALRILAAYLIKKPGGGWRSAAACSSTASTIRSSSSTASATTRSQAEPNA